MKNLNTEIYPHDNDLDVTHKINNTELENWINHLLYIEKELNNLIGLCDEKLIDKLEDAHILQKFKKKNTENNRLLNALKNYLNSREHIVECEDTQCDMTYISEHESYRRNYLYHLDKYRRMKDEFFKTIKGKFTLQNKLS
jgi:hypothetical protein